MSTSDGSWDRGPRGEQDADTPGPGPLEAFLSGGLPGFLDASSLEDETVDDPEALRLAEEAVARLDGPAPSPLLAASDEPWVPVAAEAGEGGVVGLREILGLLESEGVAAGWDPYDPVDSVSPLPGIGRVYRVVVPESSLARVRELLDAGEPAGVRYAWRTGPAAAEAPPAGQGAPSLTQVRPTPVTGVGGPLSDNDLLSGLASGGRSTVAVSLAVFAGVLAVGVALYLLLRG